MFRTIAATGLVITAGFFAMPSVAQTVTCQNAVFNPQIVSQFPNVRNACVAIEQRDGVNVAKINARLLRVLSGNRVVVRFERADGSRSDPMTITLPEDFRIQVNGKEARVDDLALNQVLTAYLKVDEPQVALASSGPPTSYRYTALTFDSAPAESTAVLPKTGTHMPAVLLLGLVLGAVGTGLSVVA